MFFVIVPVPALLLTVSFTVKFPAVEYICFGLLTVEYVPSPKLQFHAVGAPVLLSVEVTLSNYHEITYAVDFILGLNV